MPEAKSQLPQLVKAALAGEEVIIASKGEGQVRLVPLTPEAGLRGPGSLISALPDLSTCDVDAAFSEAVEQEIAGLFNS